MHVRQRIADHETGTYQKTHEDIQERVHLVAPALAVKQHLLGEPEAVDCPQNVKHCVAGVIILENIMIFPNDT